MKTLKSLTAALLILITFRAMADDSTGRTAMTDSKVSIAAPFFTWGSPDDLNMKTVDPLKYLPVTAPAMEWDLPKICMKKASKC